MKRKLLINRILVLLLGFVIGIIMIYSLSPKYVRQYLTEKNAGVLYEESKELADDLKGVNFTSISKISQLQQEFSSIAAGQNLVIWLVNSNNQILVDTSDTTPSLGTTLKNTSKKFFSNTYYEVGTFDENFSQKMISVMAPVVSNHKTYGYLLIHAPYADIRNDSSAIVRIFFWIFCICYGIFTLIILLDFSRFYRPLNEVIKGAHEYRLENLNYHIPVTSEDEIGYIASVFNYMSKEISQSSDYQRSFISNISHDFRSPLTSIKGYLEAIQDDIIPQEDQKKYLDIVLQETDRLTKLTQGLLTLNNLDEHGMMLEFSDFDISQIIRRTSVLFEGVCRTKEISIHLILSAASQYVHADEEKIKQVLYNLIDNAIKFSHRNGTITIETIQKKEKLYVSVKDHGEGIPADSLEKIWKRFYKTDPSRGKDKKGTGLGLAIAKEIIQAHNQTISVVSTLGVGSEFTFSLNLTNE